MINMGRLSDYFYIKLLSFDINNYFENKNTSITEISLSDTFISLISEWSIPPIANVRLEMGVLITLKSKRSVDKSNSLYFRPYLVL